MKSVEDFFFVFDSRKDVVVTILFYSERGISFKEYLVSAGLRRTFTTKMFIIFIIKEKIKLPTTLATIYFAAS